jgi:hypothetical protein
LLTLERPERVFPVYGHLTSNNFKGGKQIKNKKGQVKTSP